MTRTTSGGDVDSFERHGLVFPVIDRGPADGDAVVLLHGFPELPTSFDDVVPRLHEQGLRTLAPTGRGYAASCRPRQRRDYAANQLACDVIALLDAAGIERAHLVGHDWGGAQAWTVAGRFPDRVASLTVLATPHPAALLRSFTSSTQLLRSWYFVFFQLPFLPEQVAGATLADTLRRGGLPEPHLSASVAAMREPGALSAAMNWYRGVPFSAPVGKIEVPTCYVWGARDPFLGRAAAVATEPWVAAPYRFCELDEGHWLPERASAAVAEIVLEQVEARS